MIARSLSTSTSSSSSRLQLKIVYRSFERGKGWDWLALSNAFDWGFGWTIEENKVVDYIKGSYRERANTNQVKELRSCPFISETLDCLWWSPGWPPPATTSPGQDTPHWQWHSVDSSGGELGTVSTSGAPHEQWVTLWLSPFGSSEDLGEEGEKRRYLERRPNKVDTQGRQYRHNWHIIQTQTHTRIDWLAIVYYMDDTGLCLRGYMR